MLAGYKIGVFCFFFGALFDNWLESYECLRIEFFINYWWLEILSVCTFTKLTWICILLEMNGFICLFVFFLFLEWMYEGKLSLVSVIMTLIYWVVFFFFNYRIKRTWFQKNKKFSSKDDELISQLEHIWNHKLQSVLTGSKSCLKPIETRSIYDNFIDFFSNLNQK
jgi:ABC-type multidrug transport system fused ATPase/permease subunit